MKTDIILAGVGGQGVLSVAVIIAKAAASEGLNVRQSEVHGMAQRGGAVLAHLRLSDEAIYSDLVPQGSADLIISMEPMESLRYTEWLSPNGAIVTASEPLVNIPNYPEISGILETIKKYPLHRIVNAVELAKQTGLARSVNMVMVGASSSFLPVKEDSLINAIRQMFAAKGEQVIEKNISAFNFGKKQ